MSKIELDTNDIIELTQTCDGYTEIKAKIRNHRLNSSRSEITPKIKDIINYCKPLHFNFYNEIPKRYIINRGATILFWEDRTKTIVKRSKDDEYNKRLGFLTAYFQKHSGLTKNQANRYLANLEEEKPKTKKKLVDLDNPFEDIDDLPF